MTYWGIEQSQMVPKEVSGLRLWLDGTDPSANGIQPSNGASISTWVDKSGGGFNVTQPTGALQPTFQTSGINNKGSLVWNGATTTMFNSSFIDFNTCTVFAVATQETDPTQCTLEVSDGSILTGFLLFYQVNTTFRTVNSTILYDASFTQSLPFTQITTGVNDGTNTILYVNNDLKQSTPSGPIDATTNTVFIGQLTGVADYTLSGLIAEIIIYNKALSDQERTLVSVYLANKWGITL